MNPPFDRADEREAMVRMLSLGNGSVAAAMRAVPRHAFVPADQARIAYLDEPVPLGRGDATASAPHMVALMLEEADLRSDDRVLEIGGGMGYLAAVAAELVGDNGHIFSIEVDPSLAREGSRRLAAQAYGGRVTVVVQDGAVGLARASPFDAVLVSCATPELAPAWIEQVRDGGRIVAPVGGHSEQRLVTYSRRGGVERTKHGPPCRFVPMRSRPVPHI